MEEEAEMLKNKIHLEKLRIHMFLSWVTLRVTLKVLANFFLLFSFRRMAKMHDIRRPCFFSVLMK